MIALGDQALHRIQTAQIPQHDQVLPPDVERLGIAPGLTGVELGVVQGVAVGARMSKNLMDQGMINRGVVNSICFSPPLVITEADVDEMVEKFGKALGQMADELKAEGSWTG